VPAVMKALKDLGAGHVVVFVGGVVPRQDHRFLQELGVKGIYGPGTPIPESARDVLAHMSLAVAATGSRLAA